MSSPKMTRMLGRRPVGAAAGAGCCCPVAACASARSLESPVAASAVPASSIVAAADARLRVAYSEVLARGFAVHDPLLSFMTHLRPTWLVDVSTGWAWRAAGR